MVALVVTTIVRLGLLTALVMFFTLRSPRRSRHGTGNPARVAVLLIVALAGAGLWLA